jgi:hypothetical protein
MSPISNERLAVRAAEVGHVRIDELPLADGARAVVVHRVEDRVGVLRHDACVAQAVQALNFTPQ